MLTKDDLSKLKKLVREEITSESENLGNTIQSEMKLSRMRIELAIHDLKDRVKNVEIKVNTLEKSNQQILKNVRKIKKDLDTHIDLTDKWIIHLDKRIRKTEDELGLPTPEFAASQI